MQPWRLLADPSLYFPVAGRLCGRSGLDRRRPDLDYSDHTKQEIRAWRSLPDKGNLYLFSGLELASGAGDLIGCGLA